MHHLRFALAAAAILTTAATAAALELGATLGPVELTTLAGEPIVMKNYAERPGTAIVFLSSRCPLTERVIGDVNQLYRKYRFRDVLFVGVSANAAESGDELRTFAQRRGVIFPVYRDPKGATAKQLGASKTPELFLFDRRGVLVFHGGLQDDAAPRCRRKGHRRAAHPPTAGASHAVEGTPIDRPAQRREIDDPYGTIHFASELVFEKIPRAVAFHCSTICQTADGDLLCLWYGGSYESADDQALFLARKRPGEPNWSTPQVLIENSARDGAPQPPGNGVIFRDAGNRLWIVWCRMEGTRPMRRGSGWDRCRLMARTSTDDGVSWSPDHPLVDETVWCVPRNPPVTLADGTLLLPVEGLQGDVEGSHFFTLAPGVDLAPRRFHPRRQPAGRRPAQRRIAAGALAPLAIHPPDRVARRRPDLEPGCPDAAKEPRLGHHDDSACQRPPGAGVQRFAKRPHAAVDRSIARRGPHLGEAAALGIESRRVFVSLHHPDGRRQDSRQLHLSPLLDQARRAERRLARSHEPAQLTACPAALSPRHSCTRSTRRP